MDEDTDSVRDQIGNILSLNPPDAADEMPVLIEWVLVAAYDDASDARGGTVISLAPANQWRHRIAGLLELARESLTADDSD